MTLAPGTTFDDPRFRDDERTPVQRMADGDFYVADDVWQIDIGGHITCI